jgi:hypothetical protein
MAKKKSGWDGLSASQQSNFKAVNFNKSIKVSESTIQGLRSGKTFEGNVAKFKTGATAEQREAMNRFYGKARVDKALGSSVNKTYTGSSGPAFKGVSSTNYTSSKKTPNLGSGRFAYGTQTQTKTPSAGKRLTTPSDFSLAGALRAARGQKPKYGSEANQQKALAVVSLVPAFKMARGAKAAVTATKMGPKAITAGKTSKQITSGPSPKAITGSAIRLIMSSKKSALKANS